MTWFEPQGAQWTYASRKLIPARIITFVLAMAVPVVGSIVLGVNVGGWAWLPAGFMVAVLIWGIWLIVRQVTAHAWAERDDDLIVKRGRMFRSVTVVPYGRMQYVEVQVGPLARAFGIASVQLHTAAPGTDASLSGVPFAEAARLRDRLSEAGESRLAGL